MQGWKRARLWQRWPCLHGGLLLWSPNEEGPGSEDMATAGCWSPVGGTLWLTRCWDKWGAENACSHTPVPTHVRANVHTHTLLCRTLMSAGDVVCASHVVFSLLLLSKKLAKISFAMPSSIPTPSCPVLVLCFPEENVLRLFRSLKLSHLQTNLRIATTEAVLPNGPNQSQTWTYHLKIKWCIGL